jgi:signal-transduction protein with cAMP-binding, CBS, and nucleotidyltransferase domain
MEISLASSSNRENSNVNAFPTSISGLLASPIGNAMNTDVIIREADSPVQEAIEKLKEKNQRSVLASYKGEVVGLVSKTDILYKVTYEGRNPTKVRLREIMTSPVLAVDPQTTVKDALEIMNKKNVRQIMVHAYSAVLGMVYREDIYKMMETISLCSEDAALHGTPVCIIDQRSISYVKDISKAKFVCAYCESTFDSSEGLSKHIDRLHIGAGVLEGDVRQMVD